MSNDTDYLLLRARQGHDANWPTHPGNKRLRRLKRKGLVETERVPYRGSFSILRRTKVALTTKGAIKTILSNRKRRFVEEPFRWDDRIGNYRGRELLRRIMKKVKG